MKASTCKNIIWKATTKSLNGEGKKNRRGDTFVNSWINKGCRWKNSYFAWISKGKQTKGKIRYLWVKSIGFPSRGREKE